jgi:hypothetical protein
LPIEARTAVLMAIIVLIAALFSIDNYYEVLLSAAVERALDLEVQTDPPIRVTKYLATNAIATKAPGVTVGLYLFLLATTAFLGLLMLGGAVQTAQATVKLVQTRELRPRKPRWLPRPPRLRERISQVLDCCFLQSSHSVGSCLIASIALGKRAWAQKSRDSGPRAPNDYPIVSPSRLGAKEND